MEQLKTCKEVQEIFGIGRATVWRWVKAGILPVPLKFGSGHNSPVRWKTADLASLLEKGV